MFGFIWHSEPFESGTERDAFVGFATNHVADAGFQAGQKIVVKRFKKAVRWSEDDWSKDVKAMEVATAFANKWNSLGIIRKKVEVHKSVIGKVIWSGSGLFPVASFVMIEPFLEGDYVKWNSNTGFVRDASLGIHSFCHWTYHDSNGQQLLCDVQGVQLPDKYVITDPCVMSLNRGAFGMTDCGELYMKEWMRDHKCNDFCRPGWKKEEGQSTRPTKRSSVMSWQVGSTTMAGVSSATLSVFPEGIESAFSPMGTILED